MKDWQKWLAGAGLITAFLAAQFWGVPHYIKIQVNAQVKVKLEEIAELEGTPEEITTLQADMRSAKEGIIRIEETTEKLYDLVLKDFQRRAEGN